MLGDGAYPATTWQDKPYSFNLHLSDTEKNFNKHRSSARVTVERVFGVLKGRWRCLLKRLDNDLESVSSIIITCCVLHNICQQNHDNCIDDDDTGKKGETKFWNRKEGRDVIVSAIIICVTMLRHSEKF